MTDTNGIGRGVFNCPNCGAAAAPDSVSCPYCQSSLATLVCAACFGAIRIGMRHCPSCGTPAGANSARAAENLRCPRCEANLAQLQVGPHALAQCLRCGGLWVDRSTLETIGSREEDQEAVLALSPPEPPARSPDRPARTYVPCPVCARLMNRTNYAGCSGVVVDWCRDHGNWFDRNELRQIVEFIRKGGMRFSRERQKEAIRQETERLRQQRELSRISLLAGPGEPALESDSGSLFGAFRDIWRTLEK